METALTYPKDLDVEELRGMEIPDDVLTAEATGAWEGKKVPMGAFYSGLDSWLKSIVRDMCNQIIDQLVELNFGKGHEYTVTPTSLVDQAMEQFGEQPQEQSQPQTPAAQRMSLDVDPVEAVGRGVLDAAELVKAAKGVIRLSLDRKYYSSTQFDLPEPIRSDVLMMSCRIKSDDLAPDGIETEPHITVKYGLHTDEAAEVRNAITGSSPIAATLGKTSVFYGKEHDVVKIEVESEGLRELNAKISSQLDCTDTHPTYQPHVTIAYVHRGLGDHYAKQLGDLDGKPVVFDRLVFSDHNRVKTTIPLTEKSVRFSSNA